MATSVENSSTADLLPRLRRLLPSLPAGPAAVGRLILADPARAARLTIRDLAAETGTSDATVIRLARALGLAGFRDLRVAVAGAAGRLAAGPDILVTSDVARDDPPADVIAKLAAEERQAISDTAAGLDPATLAAVADAIARARRTVVAGIGASGLVARDLSAKLERIGLVAHAVTEGHQAMTTAVVLRPGDVLVGISVSGSTADVLDPMAEAAARGATTVAVTSRPRSDIARADHVLLAVAAQESTLRPAAMASRTGQLFVIDALFTLVAQRRFDEAKRAIADSYAALRPRHAGASRRPGPTTAAPPAPQEDHPVGPQEDHPVGPQEDQPVEQQEDHPMEPTEHPTAGPRGEQP
ncbi:MurR/RpiR family transcriptional regulator [Georgenia sp. TF02-10]|uniref:MurR/RpiR family transcriptional regulator n=1 Tax=Georgenia sp. TF02-10 TaxID=2917725 RepID=UPI001FA72A92|nr:MurR/RpiR family transcriptional regulator [Georgenia sp. TF02-10]UNX53406.1 MurR/RpiR family transcriptional regulator [Georgenia sp. TF02-10]